ncbi:respiratory nitrate reductase subunit beta [Klebsiella michiganensis]|uniref:Respiratory nitrate reductase subunit beta n=1 Tax=Klebsiella michiganensis TaxID=1134687 RepID=A0A7H4MX34_9ENTR|nr:respiratory nitrate reductase subunit beta [Klebsiella michiganensis]
MCRLCRRFSRPPTRGNWAATVFCRTWKGLRIPVQYLANLLTAGDTQPVLLALKRMLAMRHFKRAETVDGVLDTRALEEVGLTEAQAQEMYRYLAIANYEDRFVVPSSHREQARDAFPEKNGCGFTFGDGCHGSDSSSICLTAAVSMLSTSPAKRSRTHD